MVRASRLLSFGYGDVFAPYVELHVVFPDRLLPAQRLRTAIPARNPFREGGLFRIFVRDEVLFAQLAPGESDFVPFDAIGFDGTVPSTEIETACPGRTSN